jgi:hypothetical protein
MKRAHSIEIYRGGFARFKNFSLGSGKLKIHLGFPYSGKLFRMQLLIFFIWLAIGAETNSSLSFNISSCFLYNLPGGPFIFTWIQLPDTPEEEDSEVATLTSSATMTVVEIINTIVNSTSSITNLPTDATNADGTREYEVTYESTSLRLYAAICS